MTFTKFLLCNLFFCFVYFLSCAKSENHSSQSQDTSIPPIEELTHIPDGFVSSVESLYFINLDRSKDRKVHFEKTYKPFGLKLIRHPGVLGSLFTYDPKKHGIQILDAEKQYTYEYDETFDGGRGISPGEIGNYLSHYQLLEVAKESKNPILVMEDDAEPIDMFKERFHSAMAHLPEDWDIFYLYCNSLEKMGCHTNNNKLTADRRFVHMKRECIAGNVAYVVNAKGAQKLLKDAMPIRKTTDNRISENLYGAGSDLNAYCAYPELVKTEVNGTDSIISEMGRNQ